MQGYLRVLIYRFLNLTHSLLYRLLHSVISIYHGEHTGRKEGAPITDLALEMLEKLRKTKGSSYV